VKAGAQVQLNVDSLTLEGEGHGTLDGRAVLCRGAFPSEQVQVRIEALSRHHPRAHARLLEVERAHAWRREAPCPNHERREGRCAGCALMELDEPAQREVKRLMLRDRCGLEVARIEPAPAQLGYRFSSKRVVFARREGLRLGSFAHGSHERARMDGCLVDHPLLVSAFARLEEAAQALRIEPYDERSGAGDLRYVWAKTNGEQVILTLVSARAESRVAELVAPLAPSIAGILHSVQGARGNALRGVGATLLHGQSEVSIELLGQRVDVGALGFVQPNPRVAEAAYGALTCLDDVAGRTLAFDLYAGAGVTTQLLRASFAQVVACEAHPESARALGVAEESVELLLRRELAASPRRTPDLVIANPPRKGLGRETCEALLALAAPHVHLMSCGPEALAHDLAALAPRYSVASLRAFDTLPQTAHLELVARLVLRSPALSLPA